MKTFGKLAIAASVLLLIGGTVAAAGAVIAYKNEEGAVTERVEKHYVAEGAASALKVKTYSGSINVVKGDVETIKIDYKDKEDDPQVEFTFVDGVLEMKEKEKQWFNWVGEFVWPWNYDKIFDNVTTITVPMDSDIDYKIAATSGSIYVENATSSKDLIIDCTSGSVTVKNCNIGGKVDLDAISGSVNIENLTAGKDINVDATSGKITMDNLTAGGKIDLRGISGSIKGENIKCESLEADCTSGKVDLLKVDAEKSIDIRAVSGSINLSVVDAEENYNFKVSKMSGSANVESKTNAGATKNMSLNVTSGSIHVDFNA